MSGGSTHSSGPLSGRLIVLGITGSIAAFKAPEIVRALRAAGADVQALLTPAATKFVSPLTLRTLTGHAVDADLLDLLPDGRIGHIVAGCAHISPSIAGATTTGAVVARQAAVTASPASPPAIAPSHCAVAGATRIASALSAATM